MLRIIYISSILIALLMPVKASAQGVEAMVDSTQMVVGQQTVLHVSVTVGKGQQVMFPQLRPQQVLPGGVEVVDAPRLDTVMLDDGSMRISQHTRLTAFDDSLYLIQPLKVRVGGKEMATKALPLKVYTVEVDTLNPDKFYGPNSVQEPPFKWSEWRGLILISLAAMVLYAVAFLLWVRLRSGKPVVLRMKRAKRLPPHERALIQIDEIKQHRGETTDKDYYTSLTDALRRYIQERFGFNAMEMTSSEIIEHLQNEQDEERMAELRELFLTADLVKFAKMQVDISQNDRNLLSAVDFINETKQEALPVEEQVDTEEENENKRNLRNRRVLKMVIAGVLIVTAVLVCWAVWMLYDLRM